MHKNVELDYIVCDLPALALVKSIIGHGGYAACPKCTVYGEWLSSRMTYVPAVHNEMASVRRFDNVNQGPGPDNQVMLRTNESFREQRDKHHHQAEKTPFLDLKIDMVSTFTIDGMHTVYLGVARRFLHFIKTSKNRRVTLTGKARTLVTETQMKRIGEHFSSESTKFPREFSRPARNFEHFDQWKATEFRMFVLYGGDMALGGSGTGIPSVLVTAFRCF